MIRLAQVGMLRALYERGIDPDLLVGTSAGALNVAYIASRPQTVPTAEELGRVWRGLHRVDISPINPRAVISGLTSHRDHLVPDSGLRRLVVRYLQIERLEHASVPLRLVAFDLLSGEEVRLSDWPAIDAMLAATAIPGVLPPVRWGDRLLGDGGVVNNTPILHAIELGAERIFVLATDDPVARAVPLTPRGALDGAVHAFTLLVGARLQADLARYATAAELIVLPAVNPDRIQPTDFDHASQLIRQALTAARGSGHSPCRGARRCLTAMIRVAFLDDHPAVRAGLQAILATEPDLQVVGFAAAEHELWSLVRETRPAVTILDLHHPGRDGLVLCLRIKRQPDPPAVVLYSGYTTGALVVAAAVVGADAIVSKSGTAASLVEAIRAVARNPRTIPPITPQMKAEAAARLDPADHAILAMRVAGDSLVEIAATLGLPDATIADRIAAMVAELEPLRTAA